MRIFFSLTFFFVELELEHLVRVVEAEPFFIDGKMNISKVVHMSSILVRLQAYKQKKYNWPLTIALQGA